MKRIIPLLLVFTIISACQDNLPFAVTVSTTIYETVSLGIPQTNGTGFVTEGEIEENLSDLIEDYTNVTALDLEKVTFLFKNVQGNPNAIIQNATLIINDIVVASPTNINVTQEASNGTVYTITDQALLNQVETLMFDNSVVSLGFSSTTLSDEGPVGFDLQILLDITATLN